MAFHKSQNKTQHNMQYSNRKYCDWPLFFLDFLPSNLKNLLIISNHSIIVQMFKMWSRLFTAICWHQSKVHGAEALFFRSQFYCMIRTATKEEEIFFQFCNVRGQQTLWIARREAFIVPDYMQTLAEGNDCNVGYVEINTWQIPKAYRQSVRLNDCVGLHWAYIYHLVAMQVADKGSVIDR